MSDGQTLTVPGAPVTYTGTAAAADAATQGGTGGTGTPEPPANGGPPAPTPTPPPANEGARGSARGDAAPQTLTPAPQPATPLVPAPPAAPVEPGTPPEPAGKVEDLPAWAQQEVRHARKGEGDQRIRANALEAQFGEFKTKQEKLLEGVAKLFGLVGDDEQQPAADPEKLTSELTAVQQRFRERTTELAVFRASTAHGGDPDALLDSREFAAKVHALDPDADDFGAKVGEAIKDAVAANPKFRAATPVPPPAAPSGGTFGGGPSSTVSSDAKSIDDFRRDRREQRKREP